MPGRTHGARAAWIILASLAMLGDAARRTLDFRFLSGAAPPQGTRSGLLVVLNWKLGEAQFKHLYRGSRCVVFADGAANRVYDMLEGDAQGLAAFVPHFIKGDLDSIRADVRDFYVSRGAQLVEDGDQDTNDLDKCLQLLRDRYSGDGEGGGAVDCGVSVLGCFGGRFDQVMAGFHCLHKFGPHFRGGMYLLSEDNAAALLGPGLTTVRVDAAAQTGVCGLLPIGRRCEAVTTRGFRWDMDAGALEFGAFVSTSNEFAAERVEVETQDPLVLTAELRPGLWRS